jgi:uncharacterized protein (DUF433 family)
MTTATIDINQLLEVNEHGRVFVRGTKISIQRIIARHLEGLSPAEIAQDYDRLSVSSVHAALAFYYEHQAELEEEEEADARESLAEAHRIAGKIV